MFQDEIFTKSEFVGSAWRPDVLAGIISLAFEAYYDLSRPLCSHMGVTSQFPMTHFLFFSEEVVGTEKLRGVLSSQGIAYSITNEWCARARYFPHIAPVEHTKGWEIRTAKWNDHPAAIAKAVWLPA